jgi:hypothetical protein
MVKKLQFAGDIHTANSAEFIEQVKQSLGLPPGARLQLSNQKRGTQGEALLEYAVTVPIRIEGSEYGAANGITVDERVTAELRFDSRGKLESGHATAIDERHLRSVKDNLRKLVAADQIYLATQGEKIDPEKLRSQHKPWYVETDVDACMRLKRAYMA